MYDDKTMIPTKIWGTFVQVYCIPTPLVWVVEVFWYY